MRVNTLRCGKGSVLYAARRELALVCSTTLTHASVAEASSSKEDAAKPEKQQEYLPAMGWGQTNHGLVVSRKVRCP